MFRVGDTMLDSYEVREVVRSGGMGLVYRVHHREWGIDLAVKTPRPELVGDELFRAEAEAWVRLGAHPNTVSCAYVRRLGGRSAAFAEWVDGGSLAEAVRAGTLARPPDVLDAAIQFAWGLEHAHRQGMVHQDVKPANAMRERDGTVKVTDFGLAKAVIVPDAQPAAERGVTCGGFTPAYCSPEQMRAAAGEPVRLTAATDVWSWALSVLEMLVGGPPVRAGHIAGEVFEALLQDGLRPPGGLVAVLRECFRPEPARRPADLGALADRLAAVYTEVAGRPYPRRRPEPVGLRADGLSNQALSMLDLGHPERAEALWEQALLADPHHGHTTYNRGLLRWRQGRATDAEVVAELGPVRGAEALLAQVQAERGAARWLALPAGAAVTALAGTPDGRLVVTGDEVCGGDGAPPAAVRLWDVATGACRAVLPAHRRRVAALAVDPAGRFVVSGGEDGAAVVWDAATGQVRHRLEHGGALRGLALSPDGAVLAGFTEAAGLLVWDVESGSQLYCLQNPSTSYEHGSVAVGRGHVVAYSSRTRRMRAWSLAGGELTRSGPLEARTVLLSPSAGAALLVGDGTVELVDPVTGARQGHWSYSPQWTEAAVPSDDGRLVLAPAGDALQIWDVERGRCLRTLSGHGGAVRAAGFAGGALVLSGSGDGTARVWRLLPGERARWSYARPRAAVELSRDVEMVRAVIEQAPALLRGGRHAQAAARVREARGVPGFERDPALLALWDGIGRHGRRSGLLGAWVAGRLPEGSVLTADGALAVRWRDFEYTLELLDPASGAQRGTLRGHGDAVLALRLTADGRTAVTVSEDRTVRVWDLATGTARHVLTGHKEKPTSLAITADGRTAVSGDRRGTVIVWDLVKGRRRRVATPHGGWIGDLALSADGAVALAFHHDGEVCVLDTDRGRCLHSLPGKGVRAAATAIGADGRGVVCPSHTGASLWVADVVTRELRHVLLGHDEPVRAVTMSADGRRACSASADGTLRVWDLATGAATAVLTGHDGPVTTLAAVPGDRFALTGGADGTVRVWDLDAGRCLRVLPAGAEPDRLGVTADGNTAHAAARDAGTVVWRLDWDYDL
ncbi:protein kinase domain-containing protein [Dactylosporangium sp. CA-233914]|uniref:protein kinase domain-containing protein n=1 Tax=Dactylosporangium sp. CA-233914 TaxID=3239934 RepID=UPI003D93472A